MSSIARSKARPGMIYVHFGVVTLVATAALAWFAKGEQQRSQAERIAEAETAKAAKNGKDDSKKPSTEREMSDGRGSGGSWGPDPREPRFDDGGSSSSAPRRTRALAAAPPAPALPRRPGLQAYPESLMHGAAPDGTLVEVPRQPTPEEIEEMLRRSALRAGGEDRPPEL